MGNDQASAVETRLELREARALFRLAPSFLGFVDLRGRVQELNEAALSSLEVAPEEIVGGLLWECEAWSDFPASARRIEVALREAAEGRASAFDVEIRNLREGQGHSRWLSFSVAPIRDEGGSIVRLALAGADVTHRLLAERAATKAQRDLTNVIENMSDAYFSIDQDWKITRVNVQHERLMKQTRERQIGKNLLALFFDFPGAEESRYWTYFHRAMADRVPIYFEEYYPPLEVWTAVSGYPRDDGGLAIFLREISDQKRSEAKLREAIQARDTFLGIASHELKTPLTSLRLHGQMSRRLFDKHGYEAFSKERLEKLIDQPINQSDRLIRLVDDMLDVSRIASGRLSMNFEPTDLSALVRATLDRFSGQLEAARCDLSIDIEPDIRYGVDGFRFEQVLTNLITNVMKYAARAPVRVTLAKVSGEILLRVRDSGMGIPGEKLESVFHRFERVGSADHVSGLGLGLYISKEIVEAHAGRIQVTSEIGVGSEFTIRLPG